MASITGNNNTLIGNGASVPTAGSTNTVVLGGASSVVYMGNAQAGAAGVTVSGGALTLLGSNKISIAGDLGATGATLLSGGADAAPYWSPAAITVTDDSYTMGAKPPALYVVNGGAACAFTLSDPATVPNTVIVVKNSSSFTCTLSRTNDIVDVGATTAGSSATVVSGAAATVASNGTDWYVVSKQ